MSKSDLSYLAETISFFSSVIKSGEDWSSYCEAQYQLAFKCIERLQHRLKEREEEEE